MAFLHVSFTLSPPPNAYVPGAYDMTTAAGNMPTGLSTPGTAGLSLSPQTALNNQGYTAGMSGLPTLPPSGTNTNTTQASSFESIYMRFFAVLVEF